MRCLTSSSEGGGGFLRWLFPRRKLSITEQRRRDYLKRKPSLEDFDAELKKYVAIESRIQKIAPVHNIGALSLETAPLKYSLKSEASSWKSQYSQNLHEQAKAGKSHVRLQQASVARRSVPSRGPMVERR